MKKNRFLHRAAALLAALLTAIALSGCENTLPQESVQTEATQFVAQPNPYFNHYFLNAVNRGDSKQLRGKVLLVFFLVSDRGSRWDAGSAQTLREAHKQAAEVMKAEAASYGAELEVSHKYILCTIEGTLDRSDYSAQVRVALEKAGYTVPDKVCRKLRQEHDVDEVALLFCVNRSDRSFAASSRDVRGFEYGVLYGKNEDYRHELYHLFGAKDLYPASVKHIGNKYFPTSVMMDSRLVVDELTAYLIGWRDTLSEKAVAFLEETKHINGDNFKGDFD